MAADCTVIAAKHPDSAASEVIEDASFVVDPQLSDVVDALDRALAGDRPAQNPIERAAHYDWDAVAKQAEAVYACVVNGDWREYYVPGRDANDDAVGWHSRKSTPTSRNGRAGKVV